MHNKSVSLLYLSCSVATLLLVGCGDSKPLSVATSAPAGSVAATPATPAGSAPTAPAQSVFAAIPATELEHAARAISDCNLDSINGKLAEGAVVDRSAKPVLAGWAADGATHSVPQTIRLVLKGTQDYAAQTTTGYGRVDVAQATKQPAFANSGFNVQADLSVVAPGQYAVVLLEPVAGQLVSCTPGKQITIR